MEFHNFTENNTDTRDDMRILEVVDNYYPTVDGVVNVVDVYGALLNKKAHCTVLAPKYPDSPATDRYRYIGCLSVSGGKFGVRLPLPSFDLKLHKFLKNETFDIIHCHSPATLSRYILRYAKKRGIPVIYTVHTKYHEEINAHVKSKFLRKFALNYIIKNIEKHDYIWAVSDGARKMVAETYGIKKDCVVVPNGSDLSVEMTNAKRIEDIRKKYASDGALLILSVGRLTKVKNFPLLIDAVKKLTDRKVNVRLIIVGGGDEEKALKKYVKNLGLEDRIIFVGLIESKNELADFYKAADMLATGSSFDTSSLVVKDAYALSLPVLAVLGSPAAEGIIDGENGFTAPSDAATFADKIETISKNRQILPSVGEACHRELHLSWEKITDEVYNKYKEILLTANGK